MLLLRTGFSPAGLFAKADLHYEEAAGNSLPLPR
jgi:hypothetical protein